MATSDGSLWLRKGRARSHGSRARGRGPIVLPAPLLHGWTLSDGYTVLVWNVNLLTRMRE